MLSRCCCCWSCCICRSCCWKTSCWAASCCCCCCCCCYREREEEEEEEERSKRGAERGGKITEELTTVCEREETEDRGLFVLCECGVSAHARLCCDLSYTSLPLLLPLCTLSLSVRVHLVFPPVFLGCTTVLCSSLCVCSCLRVR